MWRVLPSKVQLTIITQISVQCHSRQGNTHDLRLFHNPVFTTLPPIESWKKGPFSVPASFFPSISSLCKFPPIYSLCKFFPHIFSLCKVFSAYKPLSFFSHFQPAQVFLPFSVSARSWDTFFGDLHNCKVIEGRAPSC